MVRTVATTVMILILIIILYIAPVQIAALFMALVTFLAIREMSQIIVSERIKRNINIIALLGALTPIATYLELFSMAIIVTTIVYIAILYLSYHEEINFADVSISIFSAVIIPSALNTITQIYFMENGKFLILIPMICAWGSDILAYLVGKNFGKHKLAPKISPNKTIEGSVGGIVGGIIGMLTFGYFTSSFIQIPFIFLVIIGGFGAISGQVGDLFFSMIKRQSKIKDYSKLIPGHGGILDRFDSIIFTAPLAYAILTLI